jgi:hypothetical protein
VISAQPAALPLRYLQTLTEIAAEHNSTIIFPVPVDLLQRFLAMPSQDGETVRPGQATAPRARANGDD